MKTDEEVIELAAQALSAQAYSSSALWDYHAEWEKNAWRYKAQVAIKTALPYIRQGSML